MSELLNETESNAYKSLVREDLAVIDHAIHGLPSGNERRERLKVEREVIFPLLKKERLSFADCKLIDRAFDLVGEVCPTFKAAGETSVRGRYALVLQEHLSRGK